MQKVPTKAPSNVHAVEAQDAIRIASPLNATKTEVRTLSSGTVIYGTIKAGEQVTQTANGTALKALSSNLPLTIKVTGGSESFTLLEGDGRTGFVQFSSVQIQNNNSQDLYY